MLKYKECRVGEVSKELCRSILSKEDKIFASVFFAWDKILDEHYSLISSPLKINYITKTLILKVIKGYGLEIQHLKIKILKAVNEFLGEDFIKEIKIIQTEQ